MSLSIAFEYLVDELREMYHMQKKAFISCIVNQSRYEPLKSALFVNIFG